jgi:hypothetical protein
MVSTKAFFAAIAAMLGLCAACTTPGDDGAALEAAFGLGIDDDDCTATKCAVVDVAKAGDPWAPEALAVSSPSANVIVGPNGLANPDCDPFEAAQADSVARYVRGDTGAICTGLLFTHDNKMLVPERCRSLVKGKLGTATFNLYHTGPLCVDDGPIAAGDTYPATAEAVAVGQGYMVVQLGPNAAGQTAHTQHFLLRLNTNKGALTGSANTTDVLGHPGFQNAAVLADPACALTSAFAAGIASTNCDSEVPAVGPEHDAGFLFWQFNGCVFGPGGTCLPGTGPQSPGAFPGRVVALFRGPDGSGQNKAIPLAILTNPGGVMSAFLTPGNFNP